MLTVYRDRCVPKEMMRAGRTDEELLKQYPEVSVFSNFSLTVIVRACQLYTRIKNGRRVEIPTGPPKPVTHVT